MRRALGVAAARLWVASALGACARAAAGGAASPEPIPPSTLQRLLLVDGTRLGARVVAVGDHGYIAYSDDDGASWRRAAAPAAPLLTALTFVDARHGWAVGHDALILATADGGESWTQQFSAPSEQRPLLSVAFLTPLSGIAVGAYGAYYETFDGGKSWNARKIIAEDKHFNAIVKLDPARLLIFGEAGTILASNDAGKTWSA